MLILLYGEGGFYLNIGWGVGADGMERGGAPLRGGGRHGGTQFNIATIVGQDGYADIKISSEFYWLPKNIIFFVIKAMIILIILVRDF